MGVE
jgi:hypothetical protein